MLFCKKIYSYENRKRDNKKSAADAFSKNIKRRVLYKIMYGNHKRGNNISAAGAFEQSMYKKSVMQSHLFMINLNKRGNKIPAAGAFYKK